MSAQPWDGEEEVYFTAPDAAPLEDDDAVEVMWMERATKPFRPTPSHPFRASRCTGVVKNGPRTGKRCGREATLGTNVCTAHGAQLPHVKQAAARRVSEIQLMMVGASGSAFETLLELKDSADSGAVRLKAATEILDRAGVRGGTELNVTVDTVDNAAALVRERLDALRKRTIEGEVLEQKLEIERNTLAEGVTVDHVDSTTPAEE